MCVFMLSVLPGAPDVPRYCSQGVMCVIVLGVSCVLIRGLGGHVCALIILFGASYVCVLILLLGAQWAAACNSTEWPQQMSGACCL